MFRHKGKSHTIVHNLKLASLLSFVAGIVNVAGFLAVNRLTTNFTGSLVGGFGFFRWSIHILFLAAACLVGGLMYDTLKYRVVVLRRRYLQHS